MDVDYYDDPQPEQFWAGWSQDTVNDVVYFTKIVALPVGLFVAISIANIIMSRKWKSL